MTGVKNIQIIFDNPRTVFLPFETVTGRVIINVNSTVKIRKIKLKFIGEAEVAWTEQEFRTNSKNEYEYYSVNYDAEEEYMNYKILLAGDEGEAVLQEGEHVYPFKVSLPFELPSTYKDEYGFVRYKAKVALNMSRNSKIYKEIQFEVHSPINLNDEPFLAEPKLMEKETFYYCCCYKSGLQMTMVVCVPHTGFVPGQLIPVTVELDNNSEVDVDSIKIKLEREFKYEASYPSSNIKSKLLMIDSVCIDGVGKHSSKTRTEQLKIPNGLSIPNLKHCGIITDVCFLNVEAFVNGRHTSEVTSIDIKLGNTPLTV